MQLPKLPALIALSAYLTTGVQANYQQGKAIQINFYRDDICTSYTGEMPFWHPNDGATEANPQTGYETRFDGSTDGDCWNFKQPQGTTNLNLASCWSTDGASMGSWCDCYLWDAHGCTGNQAHTTGNCLPARSGDGWQWKSAKCYVLTDPPDNKGSIPRRIRRRAVSSE